MAKSRSRLRRELPHFAKYLAPQALLARLAPCHYAFGRGEDVDPQPAEHAWNVVPSHVHAAAGPRNALQVGDGRVVVLPVLQINAQDLSAFFFCRLEIGDIAFFFQDARNFQLQLGSRHIKLLVTCMDRVAYTRQQICDRIGQTHLRLSPLIITRLLRLRRRTCRDVLQNRLLALSHWPLAPLFSPDLLLRLTMIFPAQRASKRPRAKS